MQLGIRPAIAAAVAVVATNLCTPANGFILTDPYPPKSVHEYFNHIIGHYVLLSDPAEIAIVDAGGAGFGWVATGYVFAARNETLSAPNICRFYAPPPTNSHFFTGNVEECAFLKANDTGWIYEKQDFAIDMPQGNVCRAPLVPIYRLYNNRWMFSDSNHRFVHDASARDDMLAKGWRDEGIAFCATSASRGARKAFQIASEQVRPSAECEDEAINVGACVATNQVPRLTQMIPSWLPPFYVTQAPQYSARFTHLTGFDGNVFTSQAVTDADSVARHSFAQTLRIANSSFGIHVSYIDRTRGDLSSINPLYQFRTGISGTGVSDQRVFPWRYAKENDVVISFDVDVRTIRRLNRESHAYGHPTLQFMDTSTGQNLYVTVATFGTGVDGPPGDLIAIDASTGRVIVGTAFRANPLFGKRLEGEFLHCEADAEQGGCDEPGKRHYASASIATTSPMYCALRAG